MRPLDLATLIRALLDFLGSLLKPRPPAPPTTTTTTAPPPPTSTTTTTTAAPVPSERDRFLAGIRSRLGGAYCTPPQPGVACTDCSGLVAEEFRRATKRTISPDSHALYRDLPDVLTADLEPGDLVFWDTGFSQRYGNRASHVGVYVGNTRVISALNEQAGIVASSLGASMGGPLLGYRALPWRDGPLPPRITKATPFREVGTLSADRVCAILSGYPMAPECRAIHAAVGGRMLPLAQSFKESQYGKAASGNNPLGLMQMDGSTLMRFASWGEAFAEWARRMDDPGYKSGVYMPQGMSLEQFIVTYVGGPGCWSTRGATCGNGETWASCQLYLAQTIARLNRYLGYADPDPTWTTPAPSAGLKIRQAFIPAGNRNRPGTRITPSWITIHETGNTRPGTGAENHRIFTHDLQGGPESVSFHYVVDDREAIQLLPHDEMGWHAGDGCDDPATDTGCFRSIAIETCVNSDGDWEQTKRNLVALVRHILATDARFSAARIAQHNKWSGKDCPARIRREGSWTALLQAMGAP